MSDAIANQLRLIRDALGRLETSDTATKDAVAVLLSELIVTEAHQAPNADVKSETAYIHSIEEASSQERRPRSKEETPEALDTAALEKFLNSKIAGEGDIAVVSADTVSRGMSKKTVLVKLKGQRTLPAEIALRVDRSANNYLGTTVIDEWGPLELLWKHDARIPQPFILEPTGSVIGDAFIVFSKATGVPVGGNYVPPAHNPTLIADTAACMAKVHSVPVNNWPNASQPQGDAFFDAQFDEYLSDWRALNEKSAIMDACFAWIEKHRSLAYGPSVLVHDDFNYNNMLIENDRVSAILDWEFAHVGVAAADLAYLWYAATNASSWEAFLTAYTDAGGTRPPDDQLDFYLLWGQLRLAVMGYKAVRNLEEGMFDDVRYGMSRWHRRQGMRRLAELLERLGA